MTPPDPRRWWALAVVLTASFLALFDLFVVNVGAPSIARDLDAGDGALQLVIAGYSFTYAVGLVTGARLGDRYGRRPLFLAGMALFTCSSTLCGAAPTVETLVAARLLQGAGAATMVPQVLATIQDLFGPTERPRAFAAFGAVAGAGSVAGQVLGGVLLAADSFGLGWRTAFLIQVPIGAAALLAGRALLPRTRAASAARLDPAGVALLTVALGLLLAPLTLGRDSGWPAWAFVALAAAPAALAALLAHQRRAAAPLLPLELFADRGFDAGLAINVCFYAEISSFFLVITLLLQDRLGLAPLAAGLTFAPLGVGFVTASVRGRGLAPRFGAATVLRAGLAVVIATLAALVAVTALAGDALTGLAVAPFMAVIGAGNGLVLPALLNASLAQIAPALAGSAAGVLVTAQQVGATLGVAAVGTLYFATSPAVALAADLALAVTTLAAVALLASARRARAAPDAARAGAAA
ncbi:Drug efflux pump JefA [Baekduia alba]|uniref:MFS transporter n=1 Tax=Baekduia alba TaxID=2997333 RepID=UPI0023415A42|nr:MFS transporter [Baekduia alba]WCB94723.1 Drug efflux pump JefA [Baekduia alba]